ncbi:non-lysosomal glucosylceramidase isoform X2 [Punica granatum]|uniref:Non-lysosomal glucosylceramidase n=1 Tax=Punica granatum TaxID=22663 RepID=A0A6P8E2T1_PUNGR|nr:non-lysosomal glucosylceramidase isoform X2 [Punica granatum]
MVSGNLFHCRKHSWPPEEYISRATLQLFDFDSAAPPEQAWRRRLDSHANILKEFSVTFREAIKMVRLGIRLWSYIREEASHGRVDRDLLLIIIVKAPIDPFTKESCKPSASQGVPLGAMGSGSISRGFRGEFRQWQIIPGICEASPVMANQFSIFISRDGGNKNYASVLAPGQHEGLGKKGDLGISSWGWNLSGDCSTYHALFPRAWTVYDGEPDPELKVSCRQISPFIPHNYRDSSLPTAVFVYTLVNTGKERAKVSLLFTWANSIGGVSHLSGDHVNEPFIGEDGVSGVLLHHKTAKGNPPVTFAIAACETQNVNVTVLPCFGLSGESSVTAKDIWAMMVKDGQFDRENFNSGASLPSSPGETLCAAVSASAWVEPHGKCTVAFALSWSSPKVRFSKGSSYHRRYTKFYGTSERAALNLVHDALKHYKRWEEEIEKWQAPILNDENLPEWYKFTLFNELYFLVAGGTVWIDSSLVDESMRNYPKTTERNLEANKCFESQQNCVGSNHLTTIVPSDLDQNCVGSNHEPGIHHRETVPAESSYFFNSMSQHDERNDVGRFLYLEGVEYIMWCTYDVHFYASFALLELFPKIELSIQRDFAKAVLSEDGRRVKFLAEGNWGIRKVRGSVPHDLGTHDPWHEMNAYNIHDTSKWKDLNPKFVLQVYRDFSATGDMAFGVDVWPSVRAAMEYMEQFDRDEDGLIENDGFPDQTYDAWTVHGVSAYCGGLWLAALQAAASMALQLGDRDFAEWCKSTFLRAKPAFEAKLWNGSYFNYDSGSSSNSKSIQADQLAGQWYTFSSGLPSLFDEGKITSTLQKIYDFNVMRVKGGKMGAVNGMHPNGKVDETCMQSREIWTGVTYAVAATMIFAGMEEEGFKTAEGIFTAGWSEEGYGYWFQTPEAWTIDGHFRSLIYMRPLSIWGMQWALSLPKAILEAPKINVMDRIHVSPNSWRPKGNEMSVRRIAPKRGCFGNSTFYWA